MQPANVVPKKRPGFLTRIRSMLRHEDRLPLNIELDRRAALHREKEYFVRNAKSIRASRVEQFVLEGVKRTKVKDSGKVLSNILRTSTDYADSVNTKRMSDIQKRLHATQYKIDSEVVGRKTGLRGLERRVLAGPKANARLARMRALKKASNKE